MILDICYNNDVPEQVQHVRMFTVYTQPFEPAVPEVIIHFHDQPQRHVPLDSIKTLMVTND